MDKRTFQNYIMIFHIVCLLAINTFLLPGVAGAQEGREWGPPPDEFDWVQLVSGEWLKGEIKGMYDKELEFDSDKLKLQVFKWKDVRKLRSPRIFGVRIAGPITVFGSLKIDEKKIIVTLGEKAKEFDREQLIAIAPSGEKERDYWSGKMSLRMNYTKGNTEQTQLNTNLSVRRNTSTTRFLVDYIGNISETSGIRTVNNHRVQTQFDFFKTRKYYYRPLFGEYYSDPLKNIKYKLTAGCGMGYYFINNPKTEFEIGAGPGYQATRFESVEPGQEDSETSPGFLGMTRYDTEITNDIDFIFRYSFQILNEVSGKYTHHALTSFEIDLTDSIDFEITLMWDRVQKPKPDDTGNVPNKDDFNIMFGVGVEF